MIDLKQYQKRVAQLYNDERKWWRGVLEKQATKADILIDAHRGKLFAGVKHLLDTGLLEKAFIFVADKRREAPKQEGVGFYLVEKGKVERLS